MIKFNAGYVPLCQANVVGFGLSEGNIKKLLDDDSPIQVTSEQLELHRGSGFAMFIFAAKDEDQLKHRLTAHLTKANRTGQKMQVAITVLRLDDGLVYLFPLNLGSSRPVYVVGLVEKSFEVMRQKRMVTFRVRMNDPSTTNIQAIFFSGETEADMEEMFAGSGLIDINKVRRLDGHQLNKDKRHHK